MSSIHSVWMDAARYYLRESDLGTDRGRFEAFFERLADSGESSLEGEDQVVRPLVRLQAALEHGADIAASHPGEKLLHLTHTPLIPTPYRQPLRGILGAPTPVSKEPTVRERVDVLHPQILEVGRDRHYWAIYDGKQILPEPELSNYYQLRDASQGTLRDGPMIGIPDTMPGQHIGMTCFVGWEGRQLQALSLRFEQIGGSPTRRVRFSLRWGSPRVNDQLSALGLQISDTIQFCREYMRHADQFDLLEQLDEIGFPIKP